MAGRELVVWLGGPVRVGVVAGLVALAVRLVTVGSPAGGVGVLVLLSSLVAGKQIALARGASALRQPRVRLVVALGAVLVTAAVVAPVASASVYWTNRNAGTIGRANIDGSGANQNFITGANDPFGVAVDSAHLYWSNGGGNTIGRAGHDGSGANQSFITGASAPTGVAVDSAHVHWVNFNTSSIGRANLDGSGANQNFITGANHPWGVAVDGTHIYWANANGNTIGRANLDGTGVNQNFITGLNFPDGVAVDSAHLYWSSGGTNSIGRANLDGSGANPSFITGANGPGGVAVDPTAPSTPPSQSPASTPGAPRITVSHVPTKRCTSRNFKARISITAPAGLKKVTVSVGRKRVLTTAKQRFTVRVRVRKLKAGRHRLTIVAVDKRNRKTTRRLDFSTCAKPKSKPNPKPKPTPRPCRGDTGPCEDSFAKPSNVKLLMGL